MPAIPYGLAGYTRYWYRLTAHNSRAVITRQSVQAETAAEPVSFGEDWVESEIVLTVIDYRYDELYRLMEANYSDGNNTAGHLTNVETHDGTAYQPQAEMAYDGQGQGQRLSLTGHQAGQSLTTRYLLDGSQTLAATASG